LCPTPAAAAATADAVLSFVSDDDASREVWFGPQGVVAGIARGTLCIESSTLSPDFAADWARTVSAAGSHPLHAPVTGSRAGAASGRLVMFAGAAPADLREHRWLLDALAIEVVPCGDASRAAGLKLVNNLFAASQLTALAEAMTLAEALGLPVPAMVDVFSRHGWGARVADSKGVQMVQERYGDIDCALATITKDLGYALSAAATARAELPVAACVLEQWRAATAGDLGHLDMAAIKRIYEGGAA
jgi:3-hydroxyisobutyrate dehydrogenase